MMSKERIFIDTGAWLAISLVDDHYHALAEQTLSRLLKSGFRLVTTNHVVGETYTFLSRVRSPEIALLFIEKLRISAALDYYFVNEEMELTAFDWLRKYSDPPFSFVDAISFVVMKNLGLSKAFAFDKHFLTAGFSRVPLDEPIK
jgi:predicted nucleic acid-binding protein